MGSYNSQYESYYSKLIGRKIYSKGSYNPSYQRTLSSSQGSNLVTGSFIIKRVMWELTGVFILFMIVIGCKAIVTPYTAAVYDYSKAMIDINYDYSSLLSKIRDVNPVEFETRIEEFIDSLKSGITGQKTLKESVMETFICPLNGRITAEYGYTGDLSEKNRTFNNGIVIEAKLNSEVKACYDGKIKDCGEDESSGKFILIDHGGGIETKYGFLSEIKVNKGDTVTKGECIARSGKSSKEKETSIYFQFAYMGQPKDPKEYINFRSF